MAKTLSTVVGLMVALAAALHAQGTGPVGSSMPSGRVPSFVPIPNPNAPTNTSGAGSLQRPVYVSGKVILEDGTPPPDLISIQMVCGGNVRSVGFTDSKGRFDVDMNDRRQTVMYSDAGQSGTYASAATTTAQGIRLQAAGAQAAAGNFAGCELQAALPGYRSDRLSLMNQRALEDPNVGSIVLHRRANVEGVTISASSAYAPKDAKKAFDKALMLEQKGKWPEAERDLQKAVDVYPKYAAAWFHLGFTKQRQNNADGARLSYAKSLEADPKYVNPYQQLAILAAQGEKWPEVASYTDRLLGLNPIDFPDAWMYNAMAKFQLRQFDAAEQSARQGLAADPAHRYPKLDQVLGVILVQKHAYPEAAQHMRAYLRMAPDAVDSALVKRQLAEVERRLPPEVTAKTPAQP